MSSLFSSDFRYIESCSSEPSKGETLFRAAVSAFCALPRPSRLEIAQLDDLAIPLIGAVSREARRYAAAALSECQYAPPALVRRLAGDAIDIAAPLLVRSRALRDVDLITVIATCGVSHARVIARRQALARPIRDLLTALRDPEVKRLRELADRNEARAERTPARGEVADDARRKLRAMMRPANNSTYHAGLRETALTGRPGLFQTMLADCLGLDFGVVCRITETEQLTEFAIALKALDVGSELAFLLVSALRPDAFSSAEDIRWFLGKYEALVAKKAAETVRGWKVRTFVSEPAFGRAS